jgi:hypothetical protein
MRLRGRPDTRRFGRLAETADENVGSFRCVIDLVPSGSSASRSALVSRISSRSGRTRLARWRRRIGSCACRPGRPDWAAAAEPAVSRSAGPSPPATGLATPALARMRRPLAPASAGAGDIGRFSSSISLVGENRRPPDGGRPCAAARVRAPAAAWDGGRGLSPESRIRHGVSVDGHSDAIGAVLMPATRNFVPPRFDMGSAGPR